MKKLLKILILTLILGSCKKELKKKTELAKSDFNLKEDITDFKKKMTDLDTIKIWINRSMCMYQATERIEITKKTEIIKIKTEFKEDTFNENPEWDLIYEKKIPASDTIWDIEEFFKRNIERQKPKEKEYGTLQISHNGIKLHYFTYDLADLTRFIYDFSETMKKLHPENTNSIYGVEIEVTNEEE